MAEDKLYRDSGVTHVIVSACFNLAGLFKGVRLPEAGEPSLFDALPQGQQVPDFPKDQAGELTSAVIPKARNFK